MEFFIQGVVTTQDRPLVYVLHMATLFCEENFNKFCIGPSLILTLLFRYGQVVIQFYAYMCEIM